MSYNNKNNWSNNSYNESLVPYEPERPIIWDMGSPPIDPNDPRLQWDSQQDTGTNPLMALLGIQQNSNGNIPVAQQKKVKKKYPALTSLFGTKPQSNFMSLDGDDGGEEGGGDDGGDGGPLEGRVEYPGEPDPEPDPEPEPYPYPEPPNDPEPEDPSGSLKKVILGTLGATLNAALQAAYCKGNSDRHSSDYKDSVNQMNTSIAALNEAHQIQQKNMDNILQKVASTGNQAEYSKLLNTYAQQREQAQSTQNLATRIQYSADNHDYQNVANEVQNYTMPDQPTAAPAPSLNDLNQNDWRYEQNPQLQAGLEKSFGSASNTPVQYYQPQSQNYNTVPVQNYAPYQQAPEHNFGTSDFPVFHLGAANTNSTAPIETINPEKIAETGEVMSAGATVNEFMKQLNEIPEIDSNVIKQAFATYQGPTGQKIQADLEKTLQAGIEKIAQECVDGAKAFKLATEISAKVAPILAFAYITQQFIQGFQNKGVWDGILRSVVAYAESLISTMVFGILITTELPILASASFTLLASLLIDYLLEQALNYLKL